jgi:hypothetical protein
MILFTVMVIISIQQILTTIFYHYNKFREHNKIYHFTYRGRGDGGGGRGTGGERGGGSGLKRGEASRDGGGRWWCRGEAGRGESGAGGGEARRRGGDVGGEREAKRGRKLSLMSLPSARDLALGKYFFNLKIYFVECPGSGIRQRPLCQVSTDKHSTKTSLPSSH